MPRLIVANGPAHAVSYLLSGLDLLAIESISADINTVAAGGTCAVDVIFTDSSGLLIARSRSSTSFPVGQMMEVTFAPYLPDTAEIGNSFLGQKQTSGLVETVLPPGTTVTVQPTDAGATVSQIRLWVENATDAQAQAADEAEQFGPWALVPGPGA